MMRTLTDIEESCCALGHDWLASEDLDICPGCMEEALQSAYHAGQEAIRERAAAECRAAAASGTWPEEGMRMAWALDRAIRALEVE